MFVRHWCFNQIVWLTVSLYTGCQRGVSVRANSRREKAELFVLGLEMHHSQPASSFIVWLGWELRGAGKASKVCVCVCLENIWFSEIEDFHKLLASLGMEQLPNHPRSGRIRCQKWEDRGVTRCAGSLCCYGAHREEAGLILSMCITTPEECSQTCSTVAAVITEDPGIIKEGSL